MPRRNRKAKRQGRKTGSGSLQFSRRLAAKTGRFRVRAGQ